MTPDGIPVRAPELVRTPRLTLRRLRVGDAETIFAAYSQDAEVARFLTWKPHRSLSETRAFLRGCEKRWKEGAEYHWAIVPRGKQLVGAICLRPNGFKVDVGYVLARAHWGKGYATEALRSVVEWALAQRAIQRVWAVCDVENPASARVMEKAGLRKEGILRRWIVHPLAGKTARDCFCYAITKG